MFSSVGQILVDKKLTKKDLINCLQVLQNVSSSDVAQLNIV